MVSWEQAFEGVTHGIPGLQTTEFEMVLTDPEDDWYGVRVPSEYLFELLRTPTYQTWQGERWLFCCKRPMTYIGEWANVMKSSHRPDDPKKFLESVIDSDDDSAGSLWRTCPRKKGGRALRFPVQGLRPIPGKFGHGLTTLGRQETQPSTVATSPPSLFLKLKCLPWSRWKFPEERQLATATQRRIEWQNIVVLFRGDGHDSPTSFSGRLRA